jgi:chaperone modulatory protein CbpM
MSEQTENVIAGTVFDETTEITVVELCETCAIDEQTVQKLIAEGILETADGAETMRLPYSSVRRTRTVVRLQRDLGVNLAGAALALELLERIDALRAQLRRRELKL